MGNAINRKRLVLVEPLPQVQLFPPLYPYKWVTICRVIVLVV